MSRLRRQWLCDRKGVAGLSTAFVATYKNAGGGTAISFMAEMDFTFTGKASRAASAPWEGRSALDGVPKPQLWPPSRRVRPHPAMVVASGRTR